MIFTNRCPRPSLGGEDLPKSHSPLLLYFTKEIPKTQPTKTTEKEMRTLLFPVFAYGCYILTVTYASPDVTDVVQKVGSQCYIVALKIKQTYCTSYHFWNLSQEHPISRSLDSRNLYPQLQVNRDLDTLQLNGVSPKRKRR